VPLAISLSAPLSDLGNASTETRCCE